MIDVSLQPPTVIGTETPLPGPTFTLLNNPVFNSRIKLSVNTNESIAKVQIALFDSAGRQVGVLYSGNIDGSGEIALAIPPDLASGVYFVRAELNKAIHTQKLVLIK